MDDLVLVFSSFLASLGGLALSILFCVYTIKAMFREPRLSEEQLKAIRERPVIGLMLPTSTTDVFNKAPEIRRRLEREAQEARKSKEAEQDYEHKRRWSWRP